MTDTSPAINYADNPLLARLVNAAVDEIADAVNVTIGERAEAATEVVLIILAERFNAEADECRKGGESSRQVVETLEYVADFLADMGNTLNGEARPRAVG